MTSSTYPVTPEVFVSRSQNLVAVGAQTSYQLSITYILAYCLVGIGIYWSVLHGFFLCDDFFLIEKAKELDLVHPWTAVGYFRPLVSVVLLIEYRVWGLNPLGYYLTNIIVHAFNSFLIARIILLFLERLPYVANKELLSFLAGLVFLVMPCHADAVSWIAGRTDVFALFFCLLSFYTFLCFMKTSRARNLIWSLIFFGLGLMSKESIVTYPFIILFTLGFLTTGSRESKELESRMWFIPAAYGALVLGYIILRYVTMGTVVRSLSELAVTSWATTDAGFLIKQVWISLAKILLPVAQWPDTLRSVVVLSDSLWASRIFSLLVLAVMLACAVVLVFMLIPFPNPASRFLKQKRYLNLGCLMMGCFVVALVPVLPWIRQSLQMTPEDRYLYFPSVFAAMGVVIFLHGVLRKTPYVVTVLALTISCYGASLFVANQVWSAASDVSREVLYGTMEAAKKRDVVILNVPEFMKGAYIFPFSLFVALDLFSDGSHLNKVTIVSWQTLHDKGEALEVVDRPDVIIVKLKQGVCGLNGDLALDNRWKAADVRPGGSFQTTLYDVTNFRPQKGYTLRLKEPARNHAILYYDHSKMKLIEHSRANSQ